MSDSPSSHASVQKKRRRPALSCEQCRRRKIKCDRNNPCSQCLQSKTISCSYSPGGAVVSRHVNETALSTLPPVQPTGIPSRARRIPRSSNTYVSSVGFSPSSVHISTATNPSSYSSPIAAPGESHEEETPDNKVLLDRIQNLETQLAISKSEISKFEQRTSLPLSIPSPAPKELRGIVSKTRFFGTSHWMFTYGAFENIAVFSIHPTQNSPDNSKTYSDIVCHITELLKGCKTLARSVKAIPYSQWLANPDFRQVVPPRETSDQLVAAYFRTSESVYRILHIPSFQKEYEQYWNQPDTANPIFIIKLLLVMSIGGCFYQGPNAENYRTEAIKWIFAAQTWLSSPFEKAKLHASTVQIQCLLISARQHHSISGDLVWISAGTLLRTAIQMGFHRDPKYLPKMGVFQAEMRRRLWATILELNLQSSIISGMPFLVSEQEWDTEAPANIDDSDFSETTTDPITPKPRTIFTQTSLQIILLEVFRPRLEVIKFSNSIRSEASYDDALRVGGELLKACRDNKTFISRSNQTRDSESRVTQFNINILDLSIRLFLLLLHRPFAAKGMKDPRFYFSRKICLETAVTILNYSSSESPIANQMVDSTIGDDYLQLKTVSGGFLKGVIIYAVTMIFHELETQLEEEGPVFTAEIKDRREKLKQCLRDALDLSVKRITVGENNVMGHLLISVVLAQIEATEQGIDPELGVLEAAEKSVSSCYDLLSSRIAGIDESIPADNVLQDFGGPQYFGMDFTMQDWSMDQEIQDSWLESGEDGGVRWHW